MTRWPACSRAELDPTKLITLPRAPASGEGKDELVGRRKGSGKFTVSVPVGWGIAVVVGWGSRALTLCGRPEFRYPRPAGELSSFPAVPEEAENSLLAVPRIAR
ncbi:MAG: hypothetical protein QOH66_2764 [Actinomycetota bacterium]|nr:hypothetical protein [Actinomycetota bacterium]